MTDFKRWWQEDDAAFAHRASGIINSLKKDAEGRKQRYLRSIRLYENKDFQTLEEAAYFRDINAFAAEEDLEQPLRHNLTRSAVDTVHAELCGRQKPKGQFATSDADWRTMRRAKRLDRANESVLRQSHGVYATGWDLTEDVMLDAVTLGTGVVKVVADTERECVTYERTWPWEVLVDAAEAKRGKLLTAAHVYTMDLARALEVFDGENSAQILQSAQPARHIDGMGMSWVRDSEIVEIAEVWRVPTSKKHPGAHAFLCGGQLLHREEWEYDLPFAFLHWARPRVGFWGMSLVEEAERMQWAFDEDLNKLDERVRKCSGMRTWVPRQANIDKSELEGNDAGASIEYDGAQPPVTEVPSPISPSEMEFHQYQKQGFFETLGVSQMRAASRKDPGVTAGVAIRAINDIQTVRFAQKAKAYENMFVQLGRITACAIKQLSEYSGEFAIHWRDKGRMLKYTWEDIGLEPDQIVCSVAPASALPNDPAGRLSMVQELAQAGWISDPQTIMRMLGWPDLERELSISTAEREHIEMLVEGILDAEYGSEELTPDPDPLISDKPGLMRYAVQEYHQAITGGAPEYILDGMRELIRKIDALMQAAAPPPPPQQTMPPEMAGAAPQQLMQPMIPGMQ